MAAEGMQFPWRWNGGTNSLNMGVIWEMSDQLTGSGRGQSSSMATEYPLGWTIRT